MLRTAKAVLGLALLLGASHARAGLIVNGDFEQGNTGFTTQYTFSPGDIGPAQSYDVVDNPAHSRPHDISPISYGDHTTGHGLMMAVNGAEVPNVLVWGETVAVSPHTTYQFSAWISSWFPAAPESLDVRFNGASIGTMTAPSTTAVWVPFSTTWDSGSATSAAIELRNLGTADVGNDFALDDISLAGPSGSPIPEPASVVLLLTGSLALCLGGRGSIRTHRRNGK
jgi:hypothetical protein